MSDGMGPTIADCPTILRHQLSAFARLWTRYRLRRRAALQALVALALNSVVSLGAGAFLGSIVDTFETYPGLLVLVPAAIGLRGNIFGAMGNRLSTSIHAGTFSWSLRYKAVLGQNVTASVVLTLALSLLLAVVAKTMATGLGMEGTIGLLEMAVVSIVGGVLGSAFAMAATLGLTGSAVRYDWDLDNVNAPLVSSVGEVLTLPALYVGTFLVGISILTPALGLMLSVVAVVLLAGGWRARELGLRQIVRESLPVLLVAGCVSTGAGLMLERSFGRFEALPALLILVPAHLSSAGAVGGILSGRLSSKLFLGLVPPSVYPNSTARRDMLFVVLLALPVFVLNGTGAYVLSRMLGLASPGWPEMVTLALLSGAMVLAFVVAVAYYGTIAAYRTGVDPDSYGIPIVTSSVDLVGSLALILAIVTLGFA